MVNAFLPIQPDVTRIEHVLGKFGLWIGIAGLFDGCVLDTLHSTSWAPRRHLCVYCKVVRRKH